MDAVRITPEQVVFFFNKYKHNSDQIFHLERRILNESYDFLRWESFLSENSKLTRTLFVENEKLLEEYLRPAIAAPEQLSEETLKAFLLHGTFFLFENNIDSHLIDDFIMAVLKKRADLTTGMLFDCYMNLGISHTVTRSGNFEAAMEYFNKAKACYPDFASAPDDDTRIHLVFCYSYEMLCYDLFRSKDYAGFLRTYNKTEQLLRSGNNVLYAKMWGPQADFAFHVDLLLRYFRIYGIFLAGQNDFLFEGEENSYALKTLTAWLSLEYKTQKSEQSINPMIFAYYFKEKYLRGAITKVQYEKKLTKEFRRIQKANRKTEEPFIFPEYAFPIDDDPVSPKFSEQLDKMKLFSRSFSYIYVLLLELYRTTDDAKLKSDITAEMLRYFESCPYAAKGFQIDSFIIELVTTVAEPMTDIQDFIQFVFTIFAHRETTSSIHFSMVSELAAECFTYLAQENPALFVTPQYPTDIAVLEHRSQILQFIRNAGLLHDIGKIGMTNLINLHFRKITDSEFARIKSHTTLGYYLADSILLLAPYKDIIAGHHKFFDGTKGYPELDFCTSPYKPILDLITICDCVDTSTDFRGRNYAAKKSFDDILKELIEQSGSRYNPELVAAINSDEALKEKLRNMTSIGRNYTSYKTYAKFIHPHTTFTKDDEKNIILYTDQYEAELKRFYKNLEGDVAFKTNFCESAECAEPGTKVTLILKNNRDEIFGVLCGTEQKDFFVIDQIVVATKMRRKGWGTEFISTLIDELRLRNVHSIRIYLKSDLSTESFFWIAGFMQTKDGYMEKKI